ncbi:hypothetical protein FGG08_007002 [Glutinoglossum americanum]|uniref:Heterokaryon incompatibility domain-containing protein n=1 Tax=Glutinoglossum americanum TaxID=1670608 RepID=A0A9P8I468_9PEZI|nr:hypothetical protein FGG08_007002 [Glutinoglossum americanum]
MASSTSEMNLNSGMFLDGVNITSQLIAISVSLITCPIHERCNGSCSGRGPIKFQPLSVGDVKFSATVKDPPKSNLPLEQEEQIPIPSDSFEYSPVDSEAGEIRLLHVREAIFLSDPVVLDLVKVKLDHPDRPKYAALSYHWGAPTFDRTIICDGRALQVNASLHGALRRHRQDQLERPEFLWVDAICINQNDEDELNLQLLLMRDIYSSAEVVFADLGDAPLQWYFCYDLMYRIKTFLDLIKNQGQLAIDSSNIERGILPFDHGAWLEYYNLFSSLWFGRTWIIQEVVLARKIRCRHGRFNFDWDLFVRSFTFMQHRMSQWVALPRQEQQVGMLNFYRILQIRHDFNSGRLTPLQLLWRTRDCQVSNPRDKVIALLGLLLPGRSTFQLDYKWPPAKLFYHFAAYVLKSFSFKERASMLSYAGLHRRAIEGKLPSWVPDWHAQSAAGPAVFATIREKPFAAAADSLPVMYALGDGEERDSFITQTSVGMGSVTDISSTCEGEVATDGAPAIDQRSQWLKWHENALGVFSHSAAGGKLRYDNPEEAFCRTLLVDDLYTGDNATAASVPIHDPCEAHAAAIASLSTGDFGSALKMNNSTDMYIVQALTACRRRRFAVTDKGYIGLVPECTELGDGVYILGGVSVPFVLRHREKVNFTLVGDAYIHGVMDGEAVRDLKFPDSWQPIMIY